MSLIKIGILAAVALILGLFVLRPILAPARNPPLLAGPSDALPPPEDAGSATIDVTRAPTGEVLEAEIVDPVTRLRRLIEQRQDETIQILQDWIEEPARGEQS